MNNELNKLRIRQEEIEEEIKRMEREEKIKNEIINESEHNKKMYDIAIQINKILEENNCIIEGEEDMGKYKIYIYSKDKKTFTYLEDGLTFKI